MNGNYAPCSDAVTVHAALSLVAGVVTLAAMLEALLHMGFAAVVAVAVTVGEVLLAARDDTVGALASTDEDMLGITWGEGGRRGPIRGEQVWHAEETGVVRFTLRLSVAETVDQATVFVERAGAAANGIADICGALDPIIAGHFFVGARVVGAEVLGANVIVVALSTVALVLLPCGSTVQRAADCATVRGARALFAGVVLRAGTTRTFVHYSGGAAGCRSAKCRAVGGAHAGFNGTIVIVRTRSAVAFLRKSCLPTLLCTAQRRAISRASPGRGLALVALVASAATALICQSGSATIEIIAKPDAVADTDIVRAIIPSFARAAGAVAAVFTAILVFALGLTHEVYGFSEIDVSRVQGCEVGPVGYFRGLCHFVGQDIR